MLEKQKVSHMVLEVFLVSSLILSISLHICVMS